ncbi:MAG TPA: DNA polymerase III subunit beta [Phycisphaerae bacterium]|nr:DNA polymerase III subunit beta [Phycisphaerae bacterium]
MKVIAQTAALQEALALAGSIVATRTPKPVLQCVKLIASKEGETSKLTLLATDLEAGCRYEVTAVQVEEPGEALVPAERLNGIVRESGEQESLTLETEKEACHVRSSNSHFKIYGYDPGEYPAVADLEGPADFEVPAETLAEMIGRTLFAAAKTHSHYAMSGVLWEASGRKLQMVATDGHRLAQAKGSLAKSASRDVAAIVPAKLMGLIQRVLAGQETLAVKIEETQIMVRTARAVLVSSLVQGNFPKYADVIPKQCQRKATVKTSDLEHSVRLAALLTNEESRSVRVSFQEKQATLSSRVPEAGEAEVTCPVALEGEPLDMAFNPGFLLDVLRVIDTDEISIEMSASLKPAVIKAGTDFLYVVMPVELG